LQDNDSENILNNDKNKVPDDLLDNLIQEPVQPDITDDPLDLLIGSSTTNTTSSSLYSNDDDNYF